KTIVVSKSNEIIKQPATLELKGKITDEKGEPLPGATVKVKGSVQNYITDANGEFNIKNASANAVLIVSYTGFIQQEFQVNNRSTISIVLIEDTAKLNEVVVVGYG